MPGSFKNNSFYGIPNVPQSIPVVIKLNENTAIFEERNYTITGVSRDSTGVALGGCTMYLMNWTTQAIEQTTISDGSGNYSFNVDKTKVWRVLADNTTGPVAGISRNDLAAS